ncbi:hypothetical protein MATL_G00251830 [Megalops atlanticus]|uniref:Apolipoprotein L, 1 n=1 Tax=Megalops atlanticus TaxID=7932 RepID=A0A9D3PAP4_MEGAT|nr:hypothetical protein MATL_G00251830 [Megalops atlanticus]
MDRGRSYVGLEEEPEGQRKQEKGGMLSGMFRRSPKPAERPLPVQDNLSTHSELSASNDSLTDNNNTKEKGGMLSGMFRRSPKPTERTLPVQDKLLTHNELSASNDSLTDNNTKEKGGVFKGMFRKSPKPSGDPTPTQDSLSVHSELSASNDSLTDSNNTKGKGRMFSGMFQKSPKPDECTRPIQDSLSVHSDLSLSCDSLSESSSKSGVMGKILKNPFRSVSQDKDKLEPASDTCEKSPGTGWHSKAKQNGVMNGLLSPFRLSAQEKEPDMDCEEKNTKSDQKPKQKQNAVVGAMSKLNPFRSASKEARVEVGADTESMQEPKQPKQTEAQCPPQKPLVLITQHSEHETVEDGPIYENVFLKDQVSERREDGHSEESEDLLAEEQQEIEDKPKARRTRQKKGKKPRNPFLPRKRAKSKMPTEQKSENLPGAACSDSPETAEGGDRAKSLLSQLEEFRASGAVGEEEQEDIDSLMEWWNTVEQWDELPPEEEDLTEKEEAKAFAVTAEKVQKGIRVFNKLFTERAEGLWQHVIDLHAIADGIDRFNKKTKIAAITGGSTSAVGGVATIAGLALAPVTMGTSLIVTAVGLGVATAGGLTSASASISNTVNNSLDRKKVERIVEDYQAKMADISKCMKFIKQGIENLRKYDVVKMKNHAYNKDFPVLTNIYEDGAMAGKAILINTGEIMRVVQIANVAGSTAARAVQIASLATGVLTGLFVGMDIYFVAKDSRELKKGAKTEFAAKIREVADQLHEGLVELNTIREELQEASSGV